MIKIADLFRHKLTLEQEAIVGRAKAIAHRLDELLDDEAMQSALRKHFYGERRKHQIPVLHDRRRAAT